MVLSVCRKLKRSHAKKIAGESGGFIALSGASEFTMLSELEA
jgi:hypothetical protein